MGSTRSAAVALAALIALTLPTVVLADTSGPVCWQPDGKFELYRLFFVLDPTRPEVASVLGDVRPEGTERRPVSGSAVAGIAPNSVSMLLTVALGPSGTAFSTTYSYERTSAAPISRARWSASWRSLVGGVQIHRYVRRAA